MNPKLQKRIERAYRYVAAPGAPYNDQEANELVGPSLETIRESGRAVTPETVLSFAEPEDSPLHRYFEWNNDIAAVNYRKSQARQIVNRLLIVTDTPAGPRTVKAEFNFVVRDNRDSEAQRQYFSFGSIEEDPLLRARLYETALTEIRALLAKYEPLQLRELEPVLSALRNVQK